MDDKYHYDSINMHINHVRVWVHAHSQENTINQRGGPLILYLMKLVGRKGALSFSGGLL